MKKYKRIFASITFTLVLSGCIPNERHEVEDHSGDPTTVESDYIVTIEEREFLKDDLDFYTLMGKVKNELKRIKDAEGLNDLQLEESNAFWDKENKRYDNINVQLQNMIELYAMSLLAKEKHYFIPMEKLDKEIDDFNAVIANHASVQKMIEQYGEKNYKLNIRDYTEESMLRDRVVRDLDRTIREENPNVGKQEINFLIGNAYEELYEDHVSQLELVINLK